MTTTAAIGSTFGTWVPAGRLLEIKGHKGGVRSVVYAPDGRSLLSGGEDKTICMWEVYTGKQLMCWEMKQVVNQVAISPDGTRIAAVLDDGSVTCFALNTASDKPAQTISDKDLENRWADLSGDGGERAYASVQVLSQAADAASFFLGKRLRPAPPLSQVIAELDADDFDRREAASKELAAAGPGIEPVLRKTLENHPSEEVRSRIEKVLKHIDEWIVTDPDALRALRAIWVLERIGTPEARAVLQDLAKGAPEVRQTQEAKAALDFLDKRAAAKP
ncbi:MAG TPA: hypothetical protein VMS17_05960 [Gemmataceae bacterium]|nr:hypothetical protein [Gemmataceae bacterium]